MCNLDKGANSSETKVGYASTHFAVTSATAPGKPTDQSDCATQSFRGDCEHYCTTCYRKRCRSDWWITEGLVVCSCMTADKREEMLGCLKTGRLA